MPGFLTWLGFRLPLALALDISKEPGYDARPTGGRCRLCRRHCAEVYRRGDGEVVCRDDVVDIVRTSGPRRITKPRPLDQWPLEVVREPTDGKYVNLGPEWDRWLG